MESSEVDRVERAVTDMLRRLRDDPDETVASIPRVRFNVSPVHEAPCVISLLPRIVGISPDALSYMFDYVEFEYGINGHRVDGYYHAADLPHLIVEALQEILEKHEEEREDARWSVQLQGRAAQVILGRGRIPGCMGGVRPEYTRKSPTVPEKYTVWARRGVEESGKFAQKVVRSEAEIESFFLQMLAPSPMAALKRLLSLLNEPSDYLDMLRERGYVEVISNRDRG